MIRVLVSTPIEDVPQQAICVNDVSGRQAIYFRDEDEQVAVSLGGEIFRARNRDPGPAPLPPPIPPVTARGVAPNGSLRRAMLRRGVDPDSVTAIIDGMDDEIERREAMAIWEYEPYIRRDMAIVEKIRVARGWTPEQADSLFAEAAAEED